MADDKKILSQAEIERRQQRKDERARRGRRRSRQLLGAILAFLMVVGIFSIVSLIIDYAKARSDNTEEKGIYQVRLTPMVWFDVFTFDSPTQITDESILQVAIWGVVDELGDTLERTEDLGEMLVPGPEVRLYLAELFGPSYEIPRLRTFTDAVQGIPYTYDSEKDTYILISTGLQPTYLPSVVDVQNEKNGIKRVIMGYVSPASTTGALEAIPDYENPHHYMDFVFQRDGNEYYLISLKANTTYAPPDSSSSQAGSDASSVISDNGLDSSISSSSSLPASSADLVEDSLADESSSTSDSEDTESSSAA